MGAREQETDTWVSPDGVSHRLVGWPGADEDRTLVLIHHGLGEHAGRYGALANGLSALPVHVWSYDARGHGETPGKRGDAPGLDGYASDLDVLIDVLMERTGSTQVFLFGHSMGAAVVAHYLASRSPHAALRGAILSAPPVRIERTPVIRAKIALGRLLKLVVPTMTIANSIASSSISSVPAEVERYVSDPLVHDRISMRLGASVVDDAEAIVGRAGSIRLPVLLYQGLDDPIVDIRGLRDLFAAIGSDDKTIEEVPAARHEVHHETEAITAHLFGLLRSWLGKRMAA
jgi:alpha-beta hydrolase superfamily lysophospholipase